jgi:hypothetical protein
VSRSNYGLLSHFKGTDDRGLRNNEAIIPEDAESEFLSATVLYEAILVLIPMLSERKWIL